MTQHKLVIAEKPSVALDVARVLGASQRRDGFCEGSEHLVSWCYGHLAGLADAGTYDERYAKWKLEDLPILPSPFRFLIAPDKQEQFDILRTLMHRADVTEIINACDAGREGELIFRTVYYLADCQKPMQRLWISSMEDSAIRDGFAHLAPGEDYDALYQSALCRAKADWLVGINASRFFSLTYNTKLNVGRVMSPTLALLVQRQSTISAFVPENYYTVDLGFGEFHAVSERIPEKAAAKALAAACETASTATVKEIRQQEKKESAPALYDLTGLQRDANRVLGYTAQQTLDYLQALYEKKLCTYPRTDSRYLTDDMLPRVNEILSWASGISGLPIEDTVHENQLCNSKKVTDHHAIIPTQAASAQDLSALPLGEQNILKLLSRQVLIAASGPYCYKEAEATISCGGADLKLHLKMPQAPGWKQYTAEKSGSGKWFPGLASGQALTPDAVTVKDGKTQPPKPFTEDTLLSAMERAGSEEMPEEAERKGLGTPATRAGILEKLVSTGLVERIRKEKKTVLVPTALGNSLITVLPEQLQSPLLTAQWEQQLSGIQKGTCLAEDFLDGICAMLRELTKGYRPVAGADILFPSDEKVIGKCPRCGSKIVERSKGYFCTNRECKFVLWRDSRFFTLKQKTLDRKTAAKLLENGKAPLKGCVSPRTGKVYDATVLLEDDGQRPSFKLVFGNG